MMDRSRFVMKRFLVSYTGLIETLKPLFSHDKSKSFFVQYKHTELWNAKADGHINLDSNNENNIKQIEKLMA